MKNIFLVTATAFTISTMMSSAFAAGRDQIDIVGSSTIYPFSTVVAKTWHKKTKFKIPHIKSTGSGEGFKLFCSGGGIDTPDIMAASRRMKASEMKQCESQKVYSITEVQIGFDGIAIAHAKKSLAFKLTRKDIFLALAKQVPSKKEGKLINNPYKTWKDVNADLPNTKIEVLGPPTSSGTRDVFAELVMEGGCGQFDWILASKETDQKTYQSICHSIREDGAYIESSENDQLIVQKLEKNPNAFGIFGFSFLDQNTDKLKAATIDGITISAKNISAGKYPISRLLYLYVKNAHIGKISGIREFLAEFTAEDTFGTTGYLTKKGLIPLSDEKRKEAALAATMMRPFRLEGK